MSFGIILRWCLIFCQSEPRDSYKDYYKKSVQLRWSLMPWRCPWESYRVIQSVHRALACLNWCSCTCDYVGQTTAYCLLDEEELDRYVTENVDNWGLCTILGDCTQITLVLGNVGNISIFILSLKLFLNDSYMTENV